MSKYELRTGRLQTEEEIKKYGKWEGEQVIYLHSVPEEFLNELEAMGLWYSDPLPCFNYGVWIHKPVTTPGNNILDYEAPGIISIACFDGEVAKDQPRSDAPLLALARWDEGWFVQSFDNASGERRHGFRNEWKSGAEAIADIKDFYFGDSARVDAIGEVWHAFRKRLSEMKRSLDENVQSE